MPYPMARLSSAPRRSNPAPSRSSGSALARGSVTSTRAQPLFLADPTRCSMSERPTSSRCGTSSSPAARSPMASASATPRASMTPTNGPGWIDGRIESSCADELASDLGDHDGRCRKEQQAPQPIGSVALLAGIGRLAQQHAERGIDIGEASAADVILHEGLSGAVRSAGGCRRTRMSLARGGRAWMNLHNRSALLSTSAQYLAPTVRAPI
jgi:hypothetical protein